jgi:hypothetical protein
VTSATVPEQLQEFDQDALARAHRLSAHTILYQASASATCDQHHIHNGAWKPAHATFLHFLQRRIARQPAIPRGTEAQPRATFLRTMSTPQIEVQPWCTMRQLHQARRHIILQLCFTQKQEAKRC